MKNSTIVWIIIIILVIIGGVVWISHSGSMTPTPAAVNTGTSTIPPTTATPVLSTTSSTALGTFLVAPNGMALYRYSKDTAGVSNCTGACASAWPPYTVTAATPLVGTAGMTGTIAMITRADGTMQVTYNGKPLYFFASDSAAGDATGQNVGGFTVVMP